MLLIYDNFDFLNDIENEFFLFFIMDINLSYAKKTLERYKYISMISDIATANLVNVIFEKNIGLKKTNLKPTSDLFHTVLVFIPKIRKKYYSNEDIEKIKNEKLYRIFLLSIEDYKKLKDNKDENIINNYFS